MTPYELAMQVYASEPCARTLEEDLALHARFGYVVSTPTAFAMGRLVWRDWPYAKLADPSQVAPDGDCWWIWLLAGDAREALKWLPFEKKWFAFERSNSPRFMDATRFLRLLASGRACVGSRFDRP